MKIRNTMILLLVLIATAGKIHASAGNSHPAIDADAGLALFNQDDMPSSVDEVITWSFRVEQGKGCEATLIFEVEQRNGWHVYSQHSPPGAVNEPTSFTFKPSPAYDLVGDTWESPTELRDNQGFQERYFKTHKATFKQKIKVKAKDVFTVSGEYGFMACKQSCFPPEFREFSFKVKGCAAGEKAETQDNNDGKDPEDGEELVEGDTAQTDDILIASPVGWQFYAIHFGEDEYEIRAVPKTQENWKVLWEQDGQKAELSFENDGSWEEAGDFRKPELEKVADKVLGTELNAIGKGGIFAQRIKAKDGNNTVIKGSLVFTAIDGRGNMVISQTESFTIPLNEAITNKEVAKTEGSYWNIFLLAFGSGLLALLTPCVFPMIPLTVSFFTKSSTNRKKGIISGLTYGGSIFGIYVLLSVPFHLLDSLNPNILNEISTNVPLNIFFFLMLFVFGLSFLGAFEITLPSKFTNKVDSASNVGGFIGTFLMALTLALVSFSCTGPILGSLLAGASGTGGATALTAGMAGFGLALGLPFGLFAVFPGWLNTLPKSGGWLNNVKVVLGLLEIAFAFKFLSQADMVVQAHLLEREVFIAIWIGIFLTMALYLFGLFRTNHDSELKNGVNTLRVVLGIFSLAFTFYLIPGLFGAPLKLIGAFPPPENYSEIPFGIKGKAPETDDAELPKGAEFGPHGLVTFHHYEEALEYAQEKDIPLMIDFTGYACVNCRLMEQNVWSDERVLAVLKEKVVIASLHVDDRTKLPSPETAPDGKKLTTYGDKWANLQKRKYFSSAQPQYILIDMNEDMLNGDASYQSHGDPESFKQWLDEGLGEYEERKKIPVQFFQVKKIKLEAAEMIPPVY